MAAVERLMGLGMSPELAKRVGFFVQSAAAGGSFQGPGNYMLKGLSATIVLATTFDLGDIVIVNAATATPVAPDAGSVIWPTSAGVAHTVTAGVSKIFTRQSQTEWFVATSA